MISIVSNCCMGTTTTQFLLRLVFFVLPNGGLGNTVVISLYQDTTHHLYALDWPPTQRDKFYGTAPHSPAPCPGSRDDG